MLDANITLVGNLIDNPNLRITPTGAYVCSFRIASTARRYDRAQDRWIDSAPLFIDIICWRRLAEHVAASLGKGDRALVSGRLQQNEFQTLQGERRRRYEIYAEAVGLELTWHPARINRAVRGDGTMTVQTGRADATPAPGGPPDAVTQDSSAELADVSWADGDIAAEVDDGLPSVPDLDEAAGEVAAGWAAVGEDDQP
ncbi:single-stranded DNA-binding protein [Pseudofrankia inefficax]|uniref:Single-stranded DNA-binding protein n=1 Tax=Pseudofrankia inefficax (strain DSM 45817 / CECT 9037 / DDB 130130 / EuI1c) TaxID=298654 RepID=E3J6W1_PSEI1|nr:single-stranded DNA-binding protein [Pseudofrankia inefficax]ADP83181.1 single-strand binding protein [Pseudofrankia inefficax]